MVSSCIIQHNTINLNGEVVFCTSPHVKIEDFFSLAYREFALSYPRFHRMDLVCRLGILTSSILLNAAAPLWNQTTCGVALASSYGCYTTDLDYIQSYTEDSQSVSPSLFTYTLPSIVLGEICIKHKIRGENIYLITDQMDMALMVEIVSSMFMDTSMNQCLLGWVELRSSHCYCSHLSLVKKDEIHKLSKMI